MKVRQGTRGDRRNHEEIANYEEFYDREAACSTDLERMYQREDVYFRYFHQLRLRNQVDMLERIQTRDSRILDVGCGDGVLLSEIYREGSRFWGVDISRIHVKRAKELFKKRRNVSFLRAMAQSLPFKESVFDVVIMSELIEHVPEVERSLGEARRVLKKGGYLLVSTPSGFALHADSKLSKYLGIINRTLARVFRFKFSSTDKVKLDQGSGHIHVFSPGELRMFLRSAGFTIVQERYLGFDFPGIFLFNRFPKFFRLWHLIDVLVSRIPLIRYLNWDMVFLAVRKG